MTAAARQFALDFTQRRPPAVQARIAEGMAVADAGANHYWKRLVDAAIVAVARRQLELTVDDVLDELEKLTKPPFTHNLAALGPAMMRAKRDKIIAPTNRVQRSRRPTKHGNRHNVWTSNYYEGA